MPIYNIIFYNVLAGRRRALEVSGNIIFTVIEMTYVNILKWSTRCTHIECQIIFSLFYVGRYTKTRIKENECVGDVGIM